ncbi:gliding motility-associated-like protein [Pontibacter mucosus]|uniref:Gliding motility-associated-like protein n=1 Tax=Pontibacter mucosus TaxID=1649266 RepID=A0A2T5YPW8_9BACT|nr:gliding motility-associated C-terminal domain-containing protein [Pontibacter mucosus]PTX21357.1 gliding motility-associated-like protein [Pontibacter mucosus]
MRSPALGILCLLLLQLWSALSNSTYAQTCTVQITTSGSLCGDGQVILSATEADSYLWSTGATSKSITITQPGTYSVKTTQADGCEATSEELVITNGPDATVADPISFFTSCSYAGNVATFELTIENASTTKETNTRYVINWGDGNSTTLGAKFETATHTYKSGGSFRLIVTAYDAHGCSSTHEERVFIGSNPSLGISSRGNTNDCAPATFIFDIDKEITKYNSPQTVYTFQFDDGSAPMVFSHANLPSTIEHTFTESSMKKPGRAFTLTATATNPCGTTPATVGGIKVSKGPIADFAFGTACLNAPIKLTDKTIEGFNANANTDASAGSYIVDWVISPADGWEYTSGNSKTKSPSVKFTKPGTYSIQMTATPTGLNTKCLASTVNKVITIEEPPVADFTLNGDNSCVTAVFAATNTSTGPEAAYTWRVSPAEGWAFANGTKSSSRNAEFQFTKPGTYTIALTASNNCQTSLKEATVVIKGKPKVQLPAQQVYCGPQTIAFTADSKLHAPVYDAQFGTISQYTWSVSGPGMASFAEGTDADSAYPSINFTEAGTYTVSVVATNECGASEAATQQISINPLPELKVTPAAPEGICSSGSGTTLTVAGADTYTWAPATGLSATTGNTVTANPTETTTYTITSTNKETGCTSTTTYTVVVHPLPEVKVAASSQEICQGQGSAILTASGADTYTWSPGTGLSATSGAEVTASPSETTTYTVTGYNSATGCSSTSTVTVTVNPLPEVNAGPDMTVCDDPTPLTLKASPAGGTWSGEHVSADGIFIPNGRGSFVLTYTYTDAKGCTNSDQMTVQVTDVAQAAVAQKVQEVCLNEGKFILGASPAGGKWSGSKFVSVDGTFTPSEVGTYTLTYKVYTGTCFTTDEMQVVVKPLPAAPIVSGIKDICFNTSTTLQAAVQSGHVNWYDQLNGGKLIATTPAGTGFETGNLTKTTDFYAEHVGENQCAGPRTRVTVIVRPEIAAPVVAPVIICGGGKATLVAQGNASKYNWYDASGNLLVKEGSNVYEPTVERTTTFFAEAVVGNCAGPRTQVQVTVNPILDNNTISAPEIVCEDAPFTLTGSEPVGGSGKGSYTYQWMSSQNGTTFTNIPGATGKDYQVQAGLKLPTKYKRMVYSDGCALASEAVEVKVIPAITKNELREVATICHGQVPDEIQGVLAGGAAPYTYTWYVSKDNVNFTAIENSNTPNYKPTTPHTGNTWYKRVVQSGSCQAVTSNTILVRVMPPISKNILSGAQTICEGDAATITGQMPEGGYGAGSYTYYWEARTAGGEYREIPNSRGSNAKDWTASNLTETTSFRRVVMLGTCTVSTSDPVTVTVNPKLLNLITGDQEVCQGGTPTLLTSLTPTTGGEAGKYNYAWEYKPEGSTDFMPAPGANTRADGSYQPGSLGRTTLFRRKVTSGGCISYSEPVKVTVNAPIENYNIKADQSIYAGTKPATLTGLNTAPVKGGNGKYSYRWEFSTDGQNFAPAEGNNLNADYTFPRGLYQDTWYRRVIISGGCEAVSNAVKISVIAEIASNVIKADQVICTGSLPALLEGDVPKGGEGNFNYRWEMSTKGDKTGFVTAQGYNGAPNDAQNFQPGPVSQDTWFRRVATSGAYSSTSNAVLVTVKPALSNNVVLSGTQTVCYGEAPATLVGSEPSGGSGNPAYLWEQSKARNGVYTPAPGQNNRKDYTPNPLTEGTWFRRVVTSASCGSLTSNPVEVKVTPLPETPVAQGTTICAGLSTTLTAKGTGVGKLEWYASAAGGTPVATGSTFKTPALLHTTTYYVQEVQSCASKRLPVTVTVTEPKLSAGPDVTILEGRSTQLQASGGLTYTWSPAVGMDNPNIANPMVKPEKTTVYTVTAMTEGGCTFTDEVVVVVLPYVDIPNTFTPNQDGINDTWVIENIEKYSNCRVEIFNQWGNLVFASDGYKQPWDGRQNGNPLPMATYYYVIKLDRNEKPLTGSVTIVK